MQYGLPKLQHTQLSGQVNGISKADLSEHFNDIFPDDLDVLTEDELDEGIIKLKGVHDD